MIARARALRGDFAVVGEAWLTGRIGTDKVVEITTGIRGALKASKLPAAEREVARTKALGVFPAGGGGAHGPGREPGDRPFPAADGPGWGGAGGVSRPSRSRR